MTKMLVAGAVLFAGGALFLVSRETPAQTPPTSTLPMVNTISVTSYQLVSEKRISRTVSEYTCYVPR